MAFSEMLRDRISGAEFVTVLTGAGISAESGVPTFRSTDGLWRGYRPEELATPEAFRRDPVRVLEWYRKRRVAISAVTPNEGHHALARMENLISSFTLVTQNIDGLHDCAGSRGVVELHGNIHRCYCQSCQRRYQAADVPSEEDMPRCSCGGVIRPDVVWFGETLPVEAVTLAQSASESCDVFLLVGTSAVVYPAAGLPLLASDRGAYVVEVNTEETGLTGAVDESLLGRSGQVLPDLASLMASTR